MDRLSLYIQNGEKLTLKKVFMVFAILTLIWSGIIYTLSSYLIKTPEVQQFIKDVPTIDIQNGQVIEPIDTVWHKTLPMADAVLYIDTTQDEMTSFPEPTAFYLTRKKIYMAVQGQVQEESLSNENISINQEVLLKAAQSLVPRLTLLVAGLTLLFLWIGWGGTYLLGRLFLGWRTQPTDREVVKRAAYIGWLSVFGLNVILLILGHGLGLLGAILTATAISVFSVIYTSH